MINNYGFQGWKGSPSRRVSTIDLGSALNLIKNIKSNSPLDYLSKNTVFKNRLKPYQSEKEWQQFFHEVSLESWKLIHNEKDGEAIRLNEFAKAFSVESLIGENALRHKDGYIIIGNRAYGTAEARQKASEFLDYVFEHDKYPPSKFPTNPNLPKSAYPDVTKEFDTMLSQVVRKTRNEFAKTGRAKNIIKISEGDGVYPIFKNNFPNNAPWDTQVNHNLPGQKVLYDKSGNIRFDKNGFVKTVDEYAVYNKKIVRAGYLSNYIFGYASASGNLYELEMKSAAWFFGSKGGNPFEDLNINDNSAMADGYYNYLKQMR